MIVSKSIASCVMLDYEDMIVQNLSKQTAVKKLAKTWLLTVSEVVQIINIEEAEESAFWIELLEESEILKNEKTNDLKIEAESLTKIFVSIQGKHNTQVLG